MAGEYAASTSVPVSKSRDEIERTLTRFGATGFGYMVQGATVVIAFEVAEIRVVLSMQLPDKEAYRFDSRGKLRYETAIEKDWEQACRQRWRTLANGVKAKLALVDDGISTVEREFLADVMTADGETVGQKLIPQLEQVTRTAQLPPMIAGAKKSNVVALEAGRR